MAIEPYRMLEWLEEFEKDPESDEGFYAAMYIKGAIEAHTVTCDKEPPSGSLKTHMLAILKELRDFRAAKGEIWWKTYATSGAGAMSVVAHLTRGKSGCG